MNVAHNIDCMEYCGAYGCASKTKAEAARYWNTRAPLLTPEQLEALERLEDGGIDKHSSNPM